MNISQGTINYVDLKKFKSNLKKIQKFEDMEKYLY